MQHPSRESRVVRGRFPEIIFSPKKIAAGQAPPGEIEIRDPESPESRDHAEYNSAIPDIRYQSRNGDETIRKPKYLCQLNGRYLRREAYRAYQEALLKEPPRNTHRIFELIPATLVNDQLLPFANRPRAVLFPQSYLRHVCTALPKATPIWPPAASKAERGPDLHLQR